MDGVELRRRLNRLGTPYVRLAPRLGLSVHGLRKQMNGQRSVSRQTEVILDNAGEELDQATRCRGR